MASYMYCSPYSYCSSKYCNNNLSLQQERVTTFAIKIVERGITIEREIRERRKEIVPKMKKIRCNTITLLRPIEKSPIL